MEKLLMKLLCACMAISLSLFFIGCVPEEKAANDDSEFRKVYALYAVYAEANGEEPLTYEEWLESVRGEKGDKGEKGEKGDTGAAGKDGVDGIDGKDGKSAYEIWRAAGNTGSEADFLEWLKGQAGEKGEKGDQGEKGDKGDKGDTGTAGKDGVDGTDGKDGENGKDGTDGRGIANVKVDVEIDENGQSWFVFTFIYTDGATEIMCVPFGSASDPSKEIETIRSEAMDQVNKIWENFVNETNKGDIYEYVYKETVERIGGAKEAQIIYNARDSFESRMNAIILSTKKELMLENFDKVWGGMQRAYPGLAESEYQSSFENIRSNVNAAQSLEELYVTESDFNDLLSAVRKNLEVDVNAYIELARQSATEEWQKLEKEFPEVAGSEEYTSRYNDILKSLDVAADTAAVDKIMSEFDALAKEIRNSQSGTDLDKMIAECLNDVAAQWEYLQKNYSIYIDETITTGYDEYVRRIQNSSSADEAYANRQKCLDWLQNVEKTFLEQGDDYLLLKARDAALNEVMNIWRSAPDQVCNAQETIDFYNLTVDGINSATTVDEINKLKDEFSASMEQVVFEISKANVIDSVETNWNLMLRMFPSIPETDYLDQYEAIKDRLGKATTSAELQDLQKEFGKLTNAIHDDENVPMDVSAYAAVALQMAEEAWQEIVNEYPQATSNDDWTARYSAIVDSLGKASAESEVEGAMNAFNELVSEIYEFYRIAEEKNMYVEKVGNEWNSLNSRYADRVTDEIANQYNEFVARIQSAETLDDVKNLANGCIDWIVGLREEFSKGGQDEELLNYKNEVKNRFTSHRDSQLDFVTEMLQSEVVLPESVANTLERALGFIDAASSAEEVDEIYNKYYEVYSQGLYNALKEEFFVRLKNYFDETRSNYEAEGLSSYADLCSAYARTADAFKKGIVDENCYYDVTYWAKEAAELKRQLEYFVQSPSEDTYNYVNLLNVCWYRLDEAIRNSYDGNYNEFEYNIRSCSSLADAAKIFDEAMTWIEQISSEVRVSGMNLSESSFVVVQGSNEEEFLSDLIEVKGLKIIVSYTNGDVINLSVTRDMIATSLDFSETGYFRIGVKCTVDGEERLLGFYVKVNPDMSAAKLTGSYTTTGALERYFGYGMTFEFYDNGYVNCGGSYYSYVDNGDYKAVTIGNEVYLLVTRVEETGGVEIKYLVDYFRPGNNYECIIQLNSSRFGTSYAVYVYDLVADGKYVAVLSDGLTDEYGIVGKTAYCYFDLENKTFNCTALGMDIKTYYTWNESNELIEDIRREKNDLLNRMAHEWDDLANGYNRSCWESEYNDIVNSISMATDKNMLYEYEYKFNDLVSRIKNNTVMSVTVTFDTNYNVDVGADIEAFITENLIGKTLIVNYEYGTVSVEVTRDMVSYDGDFSVAGSYSWTITFTDSHGRGSVFAEIYVMVNERIAA